MPPEKQHEQGRGERRGGDYPDSMNINLHVYNHGDPAVERKLDQIILNQRALYAQGEKLMALAQDMRDAMGRIDEATNKVAAKLNALADQVANGVSASDGATIAEGLRGQATRLETIGADPANPVPPEPPTT